MSRKATFGTDVNSLTMERLNLKPTELAMKETTKRFHLTPQGWHTITPRIVVHDAKQLVEFLKQVFGATGEYRHALPSEVRIGDSVVMISDAGIRSPMTAFLYVYVNDTDATYRRALDAGARALEEPSVMPNGDRRCMGKTNGVTPGKSPRIWERAMPADPSLQISNVGRLRLMD